MHLRQNKWLTLHLRTRSLNAKASAMWIHLFTSLACLCCQGKRSLWIQWAAWLTSSLSQTYEYFLVVDVTRQCLPDSPHTHTFARHARRVMPAPISKAGCSENAYTSAGTTHVLHWFTCLHINALWFVAGTSYFVMCMYLHTENT